MKVLEYVYVKFGKCQTHKFWVASLHVKKVMFVVHIVGKPTINTIIFEGEICQKNLYL